MKKALRVLVLAAMALVIASPVRAIEEEDESFSKKLRDFFVRTPTPVPKKKKPVPRKTATPKPSPSATASPSPAPSSETSPTPTIPKATLPSESPTPGETPKPSETPSTTVSPAAKKRTPNATISADEIADYESYPADVRKIVEAALALTTQELRYKYGSADPATGGMDCSGFIYYVLSKNGITDAPRDAREQYVWVRKAGNFQAVLGQSDDTFELDQLKPGDLLFWASTYSVSRDPDIAQTMIYLGREKATNQRIMVGASDGRTYKGQTRFGVSVFDFKVGRLAPKSDDKQGPMFVGYGRIPGLPKE